MLWRLVYLSVTNVLAILRLLPGSDRDEDVEILVLRHQVKILQRQLGTTRPRVSPGDRVFLAALLHRLPRDLLDRFRLLVRPDTVLRWHRDLLARRHAARSRPKSRGRPRIVRSIRVLVLRLARENPSWGYSVGDHVITRSPTHTELGLMDAIYHASSHFAPAPIRRSEIARAKYELSARHEM